ncbi:MAG TPA: ABC transporter ATP-binding protein [Clostridiales bacterium]|nr:MAG: ABC transporter ATP-binding protein [Clostridiales bacterium GWD2_32_19]HCC07846.1 ABC transporter ATP-binding protein [Clostridiales bacterium]
MITVTKLGLRFGEKKLFEDVNLKFADGNCYGIIGANGAGKTTFMKILSGEIEPNEGTVSIKKDKRMAVLKQDHFVYDEFSVIDTVIMGHKKLYDIMKEKDEVYSKAEFTDADGIRAAELEGEFAELDGWNAETNAEKLLNGLELGEDVFTKKMKELKGGEKVKVLLAQALFGSPDVLLLDEPTNHLDFRAVNWLENFLLDYPNTVIVISHDRHFLNKICTHMVDIDFQKATLYVGNYDFWYESSQFALKMLKDVNKKKEEKILELQKFIERFSANASKSKQATSRKKLLDKITLDDIKPSSRKYPFVGFEPEREAGKDILVVEGISKTIDGEKVLDNISFTLNKGDKIVVLGKNEMAQTTLFKILMGEMEQDSGTYKWGVTTSKDYFPKDNAKYFDGVNLSMVDWLRDFSNDKTDMFIRSFLGKMLFSGDEALKKVSVLSGGEKVRCMFSKLMLSKANVLLFDEPTNHLDLESIQAVNDGLVAFKGTMMFTSHDHQFITTIANRVIEITPKGVFDKQVPFDEFMENEDYQNKIKGMYA